MPREMNHRHFYVDADGRLDRTRFQYRRKVWKVVASQSKSAPDTRWRVVACSILDGVVYRL